VCQIPCAPMALARFVLAALLMCAHGVRQDNFHTSDVDNRLEDRRNAQSASAGTGVVDASLAGKGAGDQKAKDALEKQVKDLQADVATLKGEKEALEAKVDNPDCTKAELEEKETAKEAFEKQVKALQAEVATLTGELTVAKGKVTELDNTVATLTSEVRDKQAAFDAEKRAKAAAQQAEGECKTEKTTLEEKIKSKDGQIAADSTLLKECRSENTKCEKSNKQNKDLVTEKIEEIGRLEKKIQDLEKPKVDADKLNCQTDLEQCEAAREYALKHWKMNNYQKSIMELKTDPKDGNPVNQNDWHVVS